MLRESATNMSVIGYSFLTNIQHVSAYDARTFEYIRSGIIFLRRLCAISCVHGARNNENI